MPFYSVLHVAVATGVTASLERGTQFLKSCIVWARWAVVVAAIVVVQAAAVVATELYNLMCISMYIYAFVFVS